MKRINLRHAVEAIRNREEFKAGPLSGYHVYQPDEYVVSSYATVIAVIKDSGTYVSDQRYSTTTSRHQSIVRQAIALEDYSI